MTIFHGIDIPVVTSHGWIARNLSATLRWRHNDHSGVSNHQPHGCLLNRLFRCKSKKHQSSASLAFVREIHRGQMASYAENVSIWWRHHENRAKYLQYTMDKRAKRFCGQSRSQGSILEAVPRATDSIMAVILDFFSKWPPRNWTNLTLFHIFWSIWYISMILVSNVVFWGWRNLNMMSKWPAR